MIQHISATMDTAVAHGYTLDDLDKMTHAAAIADRSLALDWADKRDIAWSAIAEALCSAEEPPHRQELIRVGWQAIYRTVRDSYRSHGHRDDMSMMPRFVMFWGSTVAPSHEDRIVEKLATDQVLATLGEPYREAVLALALHDDYVRAAEGIGLKYSTLTVRLSVARRQFLGLWHEGETPRQQQRTDRRVEVHGKQLATHCSNNHPWNEENTRTAQSLVNGKVRKRRFCRACDRERKSR